MKKVLLALALIVAVSGYSIAQTTPTTQKEKEKPKKEAKKHDKSSKHHAKVTPTPPKQ
jgi:flagellar biosynthesis component FlhA